MTPSRQEREGRETTPQRLAETTPQVYPGPNYDFILQGVFNIQNTIGKLAEAVETLKTESHSQRDKVDQIGKDVHAAKVVVRLVGGAVLLAFASMGWIIYEILPYVLHPPAK